MSNAVKLKRSEMIEVSPSADLDAYDNLSPEMREVLRNLDHVISAVSVRDAMVRRGLAEGYVVKRLQLQDGRITEEYYRDLEVNAGAIWTTPRE